MAKKKIYAVVDIETTGGMSKRDRITEIAIAKYDGVEIIEQFSSLINPERSIPSEITRITGITNEMVADAPKFYEVAKTIVEMTQSCIFVAHNVRFDYSFIRAEFARLGYTYSRRQLCTVVMSRKSFPELKSHSLGNLIKHFGISVNARHRALDDTLATVTLLNKILATESAENNVNDFINKGIKETKLPAAISLDELHALPESAGVYYFSNTYDKIIYIGKSKNIQKRVMQHFSKTTRKAEKLVQMIGSIDYVETGSELVAMLLESAEIKKHNPEVNKAQKTKEYPYFIHTFYDTDGYQNFEILRYSLKNKKDKVILDHYSSLASAKSSLSSMRSEFELCSRKLNIDKAEMGPCFDYKLKNCLGACISQESPESYNHRSKDASIFLDKIFHQDFILFEEGRETNERAVILVEDGAYRGYGYVSEETMQYGIEEIKEEIIYTQANPETNRIVRSFLTKVSPSKIMLL